MRPRNVFEAMAAPLGGVSGATFAALSALRRKRIFHPFGRAYEGWVEVWDDAPFLVPGRYDAVARFSRGIGLPQQLGDVLGIAVKIEALSQDLLFVTSGEGRVTRHLLYPASGFDARPYSSVLPYETAGRLVAIGARAAGAGEPFRSLTSAEISDVDVGFELTYGGAGTDHVEGWGRLWMGRRVNRDVAFNPFNCHPSLRPAGALNRLRRDAYRESQRARPDSSE